LTQEYKQIKISLEKKKTFEQRERQKSIEERREKIMSQGDLKRAESRLEQVEVEKKELIEKYVGELEKVKESYERTIQIQKDTLNLYQEKVEEELETMYHKIQSQKQKSKSFVQTTPQPKERDRLCELLFQNSSKDSNIKSLRSEIRSLKSQLSKSKSAQKDLFKKLKKFQETSKAHPKNPLSYSKTPKPTSSQEGPLTGIIPITIAAFPEETVALKEHNLMLEENVGLKFEVVRAKARLEEMKQENARMEGRCRE
jgi:chromosome segregation ATPase